jgi:hypothetical protein
MECTKHHDLMMSRAFFVSVFLYIMAMVPGYILSS